MWNYRVVKYRKREGYGLHEVFYDDEGLPWAMTESPVGFACDLDEGVNGVVNALLMAIKDAQKNEVLEEPEPGKWPGKAP